MKLSKSKIVKGYSVNLAEDKFTIPVSPPELEIEIEIESELDEDIENPEEDIDTGVDIDEKKPEKIEKPAEKMLSQQREISPQEAEIKDLQADILAHMEKLGELTEKAKEIESTSRLIGEEIIGQAQRTADLVINHTLESAKTELNNALSQGYSDGFEAGKNEAMNIISPALDKIKIMNDAVLQIQDKMLEDFRDEMFNIIAEISKKILHREIDEKDEYLITLFSDAVKDIRAENYVTVTVSEAQADFAVRNIDLFRAKVANIEDFKIIPDKNADRGTMIVETAKTVADASFNVQIESINNILDRMKENLLIPASDLISSEDNSHNINIDIDNGGLSGLDFGLDGEDGADVAD